MEDGFGHDKVGTGFQRPVHLSEETPRIGRLVDHRKRQREVDAAIEGFQPQTLLRTWAQLDALEKPGLLGARLEPGEHLLLHIHAQDLSRRPHAPRQRETEESHGAPDVQDRHPLPDAVSEHLLWRMRERPQRAEE